MLIRTEDNSLSRVTKYGVLVGRRYLAPLRHACMSIFDEVASMSTHHELGSTTLGNFQQIPTVFPPPLTWPPPQSREQQVPEPYQSPKSPMRHEHNAHFQIQGYKPPTQRKRIEIRRSLRAKVEVLLYLEHHRVLRPYIHPLPPER